MANLLKARAAFAACVGVACLGLLTSSAHAQNQQSPFPTLAGHFVLVVPQGDIPYAVAGGLPVAPESHPGRRIAVPRVVTLIAPSVRRQRDHPRLAQFDRLHVRATDARSAARGLAGRHPSTVRPSQRDPSSLVDCGRTERKARHRNAGPVLRGRRWDPRGLKTEGQETDGHRRLGDQEHSSMS